MIGLYGVAAAAPLLLAQPEARLLVGGDSHLDWDWYQSGQDTTALFFSAGNAFDADVVVHLGDLYGARKSDTDGDRDWDCPLDGNGNVLPDGLRSWATTCEYPSAWLGQRYATDAAIWTLAHPGRPILWGTGNHDVPPPLPGIASLDEVGEWERTWLHPDDQPCVTEAGREYQRCDLIVANAGQSRIWTILQIPDQTGHQDRAVGGRCDLRDYDGLDAYRAGCSPFGWPVGVVTPYQLEWLESQIALAQTEGRLVVVATHHPVPGTVALSDRAASYVPQCAQQILVQRPPPSPHMPRDADLLPLRTDLDTPIPGDPLGRTPLQAGAEYVGSVVRWYPGQSPDETWGLDLVRRYPGVVKVWLSGHNHVPVPDLVDATTGRGMIYRDPASGTAFLAHGAITRYWLTTSGTGHPQAAILDLGADGHWAWTRISIQSHATGLAAHGCGTAAQLPPNRPAPWVGVPVETGP